MTMIKQIRNDNDDANMLKLFEEHIRKTYSKNIRNDVLMMINKIVE